MSKANTYIFLEKLQLQICVTTVAENILSGRISENFCQHASFLKTLISLFA